MLIMEDFVPFEIAKKLKEKGFPQRPNYFNYGSYYNWDGLRKTHSLSNASVWFDPIISRDNIYFAPTISQVFKWLREEKKIFVAINIGYCYEPFLTNPKMEPTLKGYYYGIWELDNLNNKNALSEYFEAPEQAAIAGIEYVIDNLI
jgi:hypothetical protein